MTSPEYQPYGQPEQPATPYIPTQPTRVEPVYNPPAADPYATPYAAPPAYQAPVSAPSGYAPASGPAAYAAPASGPAAYAAPVSAPAGYAPVSAPAASGYPVVYPPVAATAAPAKGGKGMFVTVSIVAVLCLVATAVLTVMFLNKSDQYNKANKLANDRATTITTDEAAIATAKDQLTTANALSTKLQGDLDDQKNQLTEVTHERDVIAKCVNDLNKFFAAVDRHASNATLNKLLATEEKSCHDADKYLN